MLHLRCFPRLQIFVVYQNVMKGCNFDSLDPIDFDHVSQFLVIRISYGPFRDF